ncbi:hypothetical protein EON66_10780 [archaeon]|nr:MAG: hypothetical protein EON66_10780 [archaeon]
MRAHCTAHRPRAHHHQRHECEHCRSAQEVGHKGGGQLATAGGGGVGVCEVYVAAAAAGCAAGGGGRDGGGGRGGGAGGRRGCAAHAGRTRSSNTCARRERAAWGRG